MALHIDVKESAGVTVLTLAGRVTLGDESNQLRSKIKELLAQGKKRLVLDLGGVTYIDSAGLGTLVAAYTSTRNEGGDIRLANITSKFNELLTITKLLTIFDVHTSVADALKSFS
ncbi:MAG TPA: STAS domain-containing protein [Terriglobia bacterium]|nr:STAS domain-containing protein [Terriglobia bacterium]HVB29213.1 STAS domain-containing protein [Terriglobia bacterium]